MEALLNCTKILTNQAQYEPSFNGEFGPLIQHNPMNSLRSNPLSVNSTTRVTNIPTVPRREKPVSELSMTEKETLRRAKLESKRRFCRNDSEFVSNAPVVNNHHDMISSQLDICTIRSQHMSAGERYQAPIYYVEAYADFGMQCTEYKSNTLMKYEADKA